METSTLFSPLRVVMMFIENLKRKNAHFFWDQLRTFNNEISAFLGTIRMNNSKAKDYEEYLKSLVKDLNVHLSKDNYCLRLFYDLDNNKSPLIHYFLIVEKSEIADFEKSLLYAMSNIRKIDDRLPNYKETVDHYFEYHDLYGYERVQKIFC